MRWMLCLFGVVACGGVFSLQGEETRKTRDELVRDDRDGLLGDAAWVYNDFEAAREQARRSGKPLLVVHRCVP